MPPTTSSTPSIRSLPCPSIHIQTTDDETPNKNSTLKPPGPSSQRPIQAVSASDLRSSNAGRRASMVSNTSAVSASHGRLSFDANVFAAKLAELSTGTAASTNSNNEARRSSIVISSSRRNSTAIPPELASKFNNIQKSQTLTTNSDIASRRPSMAASVGSNDHATLFSKPVLSPTNTGSSTKSSTQSVQEKDTSPKGSKTQLDGWLKKEMAKATKEAESEVEAILEKDSKNDQAVVLTNSRNAMRILNLKKLEESRKKLARPVTRHDIVVRKWKDATQAVITVLRTYKMFEKSVNVGNNSKVTTNRIELARHRITEQSSLMNILKAAKFDYIMRVADEIRGILSKPPQDLRESDYQTLERLLNVLPSYAKQDTDARKLLARVMELEVYPASQVIIKQTHNPESFYFILTGQCEVYKKQIKDGVEVTIPLSILNPGDSFGEYAIFSKTKRSATVSTTMRTELLRVDKVDFMATKTTEYKFQIMKGFGLFKQNPSINDSAIFYLCQYCDQIRFQPQTTIVQEGKKCNDIYFIKSGSCRAIRSVPFIAKTTTVSPRVTETKKYPYSKEYVAANPDAQVVHELLTIKNFEVGDFFPSVNIKIPETVIDLQMYAAKYFSNILEQLQLEQIASVSVVTNSLVECYKISRADFGKCFTPEALKYLAEHDSKIDIPIGRLQEVYLEKIEWEDHKKKVVQEVVRSGK